MIRLIFSGSLTVAPSESRMAAYLADCQQRFARHGISGLMVLMGCDFLQVMEGPAADVAHEYDLLAAQNHRYRITLLARQAIERRMFTDWHMGLVSPPQPGVEASVLLSPSLLDLQRYVPQNDGEQHMLHIIDEFIAGKWHLTPPFDASRPITVLRKNH